MPQYSFDISYFTDNPNVNDSDVFEITNKYENCKWYASDTGPFNSNKKVTRNNGFMISNIDDLKNIIEEVNESNGLFIDFINVDNNENEDSVRIYASLNSLNAMENKSEYFDTISNLTEENLEIFRLASNNSFKNDDSDNTVSDNDDSDDENYRGECIIS